MGPAHAFEAAPEKLFDRLGEAGIGQGRLEPRDGIADSVAIEIHHTQQSVRAGDIVELEVLVLIVRILLPPLDRQPTGLAFGTPYAGRTLPPFGLAGRSAPAADLAKSRKEGHRPFGVGTVKGSLARHRTAQPPNLFTKGRAIDGPFRHATGGHAATLGKKLVEPGR